MPRPTVAACRYALALLAALALLPAAHAQNFPTRPIRLVVTTPPGGLVDLLGRAMAQSLGERLGQPLVVENRSGGTTHIGLEMVARSPADGHTLIVGTPEMAMLPALKKNYPLDPLRDLAPVALFATSWTVFAVNPKFPANTLAELVSYAKSNPGKVRYGTNGVGSVLHLAVEMLSTKAGINLVHVPYKGGAQAAVDAVSGQIEMASIGLASSLSRRTQLRLLAQTGPRRHPKLSEVPTTAELGMPEVVMETWFGIMAPGNTPQPVVARLASEIDQVLKQETIKERFFSIGCETAWKPPAAFASFLSEEIRKFGRLIPAAGIPQED